MIEGFSEALSAALVGNKILANSVKNFISHEKKICGHTPESVKHKNQFGSQTSSVLQDW